MGAFAKRNWTPASILIVSKLVSSYGAGGGGRTRTVVMPRDFKACIPSGRQRKYTELQVQDPLKINAFHRFLKKQEPFRQLRFFRV